MSAQPLDDKPVTLTRLAEMRAAVAALGRLEPPPPPASPGAYDFGRNAYFQGMGGTLFALGPTRAADLAPPPWRVRMAMKVNAVRYALAERIVARLGERTGGVAAASASASGTCFTPCRPPRSRSLARACTCPVTSVSAGPPEGGLYLKPPS